jgi:hypothetical protein
VKVVDHEWDSGDFEAEGHDLVPCDASLSRMLEGGTIVDRHQ